LGLVFAGLAVSGLLAVAAGGGAGLAAFLLGSERAGAAAGKTDDEGEGGEYFHEDGSVAVG
jgi:hypothetical protein